MDVRWLSLPDQRERRNEERLLAQIAEGEIQILIGTHALIEDTVVFSSLGLAIIDEQHSLWC